MHCVMPLTRLPTEVVARPLQESGSLEMQMFLSAFVRQAMTLAPGVVEMMLAALRHDAAVPTPYTPSAVRHCGALVKIVSPDRLPSD